MNAKHISHTPEILLNRIVGHNGSGSARYRREWNVLPKDFGVNEDEMNHHVPPLNQHLVTETGTATFPGHARIRTDGQKSAPVCR